MQQQDPVIGIEQQDPGHLTHLDGFLSRTSIAAAGGPAVRGDGAIGPALRDLRPVA
ncbi:hypothetical protein K530_50105 [Streptomyces noursei CCRC 11814]|nr:hypothetical protein K530_50105 [Streptomyces noursei CCRC 11814]